MSVPCSAFRRLLERALVGKPDPERLSGLSFHEHVLACAACRELLEGEEALEALLASWPCPELPAELSARLIERLREARRLEELLDLDAGPQAGPLVPEGLAQRVLRSQVLRDALARDGSREVADRYRMEARLDAWLDAAGEVDLPVGLSARVLGALREREKLIAPASPPARRPVAHTVRYRAAAALVATLSLVALWRAVVRQRGVSGPDELEIAMALPPEELLSALPALENWEVLFVDDDPELVTGMDFTAEDEALLEFASVDLLEEVDGGAGAPGAEPDGGSNG